jgi:hypothetical protein
VQTPNNPTPADLSLIREVVADGLDLEALKSCNPEKHRPPFVIDDVIYQLAPYPYVAITFDAGINWAQFGKSKTDAQAAVLFAPWFPAGYTSGDLPGMNLVPVGRSEENNLVGWYNHSEPWPPVDEEYLAYRIAKLGCTATHPDFTDWDSTVEYLNLENAKLSAAAVYQKVVGRLRGAK